MKPTIIFSSSGNNTALIYFTELVKETDVESIFPVTPMDEEETSKKSSANPVLSTEYKQASIGS